MHIRCADSTCIRSNIQVAYNVECSVEATVGLDASNIDLSDNLLTATANCSIAAFTFSLAAINGGQVVAVFPQHSNMSCSSQMYVLADR
jgi:hypothetical protein